MDQYSSARLQETKVSTFVRNQEKMQITLMWRLQILFFQTLLRFLSWATLIAKAWLEMKQSKTRCFALVEKVRELKRWVEIMSFCLIVARKSNPARSQGDSGGSLTVEMDGAHILAGITSFALSDSKVDLNDIAGFNKCSRTYLTFTPVCHLSCPGSTPQF